MIFSPNSTTGRQLDKAWMMDEKTKDRVLLKSANTMLLTKPIHEVLAYELPAFLVFLLQNMKIRLFLI